jgi:hypothetical protein
MMMRTDQKIVHSEAYSARIEALLALRADDANADGDRLKAAAEKLRVAADSFGVAASASTYAAFAELTHLIGLLYEWRAAVRSAAPDAQRFLAAAQTRAVDWLTTFGAAPELAKMKGVAETIRDANSVHDVSTMATALASIPFPVGMYARPKPDGRTLAERMGGERVEKSAKRLDLTVAFVTFTIDGRPLADIHYVKPGATHDMDIEVRVSRWPEGATHLVLEPVTVEPAGTYELPTFEIKAPKGDAGPFKLSAKGRAILKVPQQFGARPYEFKYAARFIPFGTEQPVEVAGQRTLSLEGLDLQQNSITGYSAIDEKVVQLRNTLRAMPYIPQDELADLLTIAQSAGNYLAQVMHDDLFTTTTSEKDYQRALRAHLRSNAKIGSQLEEAPRAAGGITDLSFRGIRIELKVENDQRITIEDCVRYVGQTATYIIGSGKHVGVLCVLDSSPKKVAPFPMQDGIAIYPLQEGNGTPIYILIFLMQGNLATPSSLSR